MALEIMKSKSSYLLHANGFLFNISEAWHSRFQSVVAKHHPTLFVFLKELQKEQADSELTMGQLAIGQRVKKVQDRKRGEKEDRIYCCCL